MQLVILSGSQGSLTTENPRALRNYAESTLPVLYKCNNIAWMTTRVSTRWFTEYFKPTSETYSSGKMVIPFKILLLVDRAPGVPRAPVEMGSKMNAVFGLLTQHPFCSPWAKESL